MRNEYTAVVKKSGDWWIGWIEEVPGVNCQEHAHDELLESLKEALKEAIELNRNDAREAAGGEFSEIKIAV
jgi:predicted RNase H-like HicB family nuclease